MRWLVLLALVACDPPSRGPRFQAAGKPPHPGGTLRIATKDAVSTLDPAIAYDETSTTIVHPLHDTLVDYDRDAKLVPRLASSWTISPDGLVYRFTLRDARYSDGRPIVAADFVRALEHAKTSETSPFGSFLADVAGLAAHDRELEIRLARPNAALLATLTMAFASPLPDHAGDQRRGPISSGPYELVSWDEGQRVVLRRNPHYWDPGRGRVERIELLENVARETQFLMFERAELDAVERLSLTGPDYLWIVNQPAWQPFIHRRTSLYAFGARMNVREKPFDDRRVRQALNYALDKTTAAKLLGGGAISAHGLLPPGVFGRDDAIDPYPHDPAKARALLAEAGYPHGFDVEYLTVADEESEKLAQSMQSDFAKVGVRVSIRLVSFPVLAATIGKPDGAAFSFIGWYGDFPDPTAFFDPKFHSRAIADENSSNDSFYVNPELDSLIDAARAEVDRDRRAALYRRIERILFDDAPWVFDYHRMTVEITQPYVRDYEPHAVWPRDFTGAWLDR